MVEQIDFNATIGPVEVGVIVGASMFGIFSLQVFNYFRYFPEDSVRLKATVAVLWILELVHVILSCVGLYMTTVIHFSDGANALFINKAIGLSLIISAIVGPGVQDLDFLCLSRSRFIRLPIGPCDLLVPLLHPCNKSYRLLLSIGVSTTVDFIVAISLCTLLWQCRTRSAIKSTQQTVDSLLAWTINTGLLTSAASILMLIFFVTMANFAWLTMLLVIPRLFANSMLASLNSRNKFRDEGNTHLSLNDVHPSSVGATSNYRRFTTAIAIEMTHTREVVQDTSSSDKLDTKVDLEERSVIGTQKNIFRCEQGAVGVFQE
ncbi:hypothetical protein K438DRAFT_652057 [Mycena galopus ATCC 62051]|nr:hypothetical protein K438DRAFT_652057 [Mycena galopus ATCC 62051]